MGSRVRSFECLLLLCLGAVFVGSGVGAQAAEHPLEPPDTSSPRATLQTFIEEGSAAWTAAWDAGSANRDSRIAYGGRAIACLDLSEVRPVELDDVGLETGVQLLDVFNRIPLPPWEQVPDAAEMERRGRAHWVVPHTSIRIARVEEGPRAGEWLFTPDLPREVREYYR